MYPTSDLGTTPAPKQWRFSVEAYGTRTRYSCDKIARHRIHGCEAYFLPLAYLGFASQITIEVSRTTVAQPPSTLRRRSEPHTVYHHTIIMPAFPYKLHELLETTTSDAELSSIISWLPDGKSFRIHSAEEFEQKVLPQYFPRQSQVKSFKRQLQYYDFENYGDGLFSHPCFRRGHRNMCGRIMHQLPTKSQKENGGGPVRAQKARGRKKKNRSSSIISTGNKSSGSLKSRILKAAAGDASVVSLGSDSSMIQEASPLRTKDVTHQTITNIPKFVLGKEQQLSPNSDVTPEPQEMGKTTMMPMPILSAQLMLSQQQHLAQQKQLACLQQMQAMQMARQRYLSCLQQEIMLRSMLRQGRGNVLVSSPPSMMLSSHRHELLLQQKQGMIPQQVPSSKFD